MNSVQIALASAGDLPDGNAWLSERERAVLASLRFEKRARDWRLGRWVAKQAARHFFPRDALEVIAAADGAPVLYVNGVAANATISISHSNDQAMAVARIGAGPIGCDVERIEPRSVEFIESYFTSSEIRAIDRASDTNLIANAIWSGKESVLKATRDGLRRDTRAVQIVLSQAGDLVGFVDGVAYEGNWWAADGFVYSIAVGLRTA